MPTCLLCDCHDASSMGHSIMCQLHTCKIPVCARFTVFTPASKHAVIFPEPN